MRPLSPTYSDLFRTIAKAQISELLMSKAHGLETLFRDSLAGQFCYYLSGRRWFRPEYESETYIIPERYLVTASSSSKQGTSSLLTEGDEKRAPANSFNDETSRDSELSSTNRPDGVILVDWDGPNDISFPQNWPFAKKAVVAVIMAVCTSSLYMGSALFTPAEEQIREHFHTTTVKVTLGLSMFVWGYGIASLWFSPMSENPLFGGRLYLYIFTQTVFCCLQIPTALVNHVAPFAVLRLLAGIMAAPPLSTGGATYNDIFGFPTVTYALIIWSIGALMGPFIGPLIGGALVQHNTWRWAFWYLLIMSGSVLLLMVLFFPETSEQAILMKKARSLRRRTGNPNILAPGDLLLRSQKASHVLKHIFWQPVKLTVQEPTLLLMDIHLGLMYSVMYLYFEAVPICYGGVYHFNLVQQGMSYLPFLVGCAIVVCLYVPYIHYKLIKPMMSGNPPDVFKVFSNAAIVGSTMAPTGMLIFGWTAHHNIHWVVSMVGNMIFCGAVWLMFQSYMAFLANLYPPAQVASAFASNGVARAVLAAAFPLFARPMYDTLAIEGYPIGWGCSLLAFICIALIGLPVYLRIRGKALHDAAIAKYGAH